MRLEKRKIYVVSDRIIVDDVDKQILHFLSQGDTAKEIGPKVHLTPRGVEGRIKKMLECMGAKNALQLVLMAIEENIFEYKKQRPEKQERPPAEYSNETPFNILKKVK